MAVAASCPGCGAGLEYRHGAVVVICAHCDAAAARSDRGVESLGKVVDLVPTSSPLDLGLRGAVAGAGFELVGHVQLQHGKGGVWDEWFAAFDDGRWGWLAEAEGRLWLTFPEEGFEPPSHALAKPGARITINDGEYTVRERGRASHRGARGQLPCRFTPGAEYDFIDAVGKGRLVATIDYGDLRAAADRGASVVFVGREVTLGNLGLAGRAPVERSAPKVRAERLSCPNCNGNLELRMPDQTQRIGCPYCGALLDVTESGSAQKIALLGRPPALALPLGAVGEFFGGRFTVVGWLERIVEAEGVRYPWEEFLLHDRERGFRWLVLANGHWSYVEPASSADVEYHQDGDSAQFEGQAYKIYTQGRAKVDRVLGECFWKVEPGEETQTRDFIAPPRMLSWEADDDEESWSLGTYVTGKEVARAFHVASAATPTVGVAPHQPFVHKSIYAAYALLVAALVIIWVVANFTAPRKAAFHATYTVPTTASGETPLVIFSDSFALARQHNVEVTLAAPALQNSWISVQADLVREEDGRIETFSAPLEYYRGNDDGEYWTEGSFIRRTFLPAGTGGRYLVRLDLGYGAQTTSGRSIMLTVREGVPHPNRLVTALLLGGLLPLLVGIWHYHFHRRRWADSEFSGQDDE